MISLDAFLAKVREIDAEHPAYRSGGSATDGTCDCIGLIIGAIRRAGGKWTGTHGSNYAARYEWSEMWQLPGHLEVGDIVFKKYEPGEDGYNLPAAYRSHSDQRDYYHAGVVLSVNPLDIVHCTMPTTKHDTTLGKWAFAAELKSVDYGRGKEVLYQAVVTTEKDPLRVRELPETGKVLGHVPKGATVDVIGDTDPFWPRVRYGDLVGYVSSAYITGIGSADRPGADEPEADGVRIPLALARQMYRALGDALSVD